MIRRLFSSAIDVALSAPSAAVDLASQTVNTVGAHAGVAVRYVIPEGGLNFAGINIQVNPEEAGAFLYQALVPKVAQAVLQGRMPDREDFVDDAIMIVGGPLEGIYVAANSKTADMLSRGEVPELNQIGSDMVRALTPVAMKRFGL